MPFASLNCMFGVSYTCRFSVSTSRLCLGLLLLLFLGKPMLSSIDLSSCLFAIASNCRCRNPWTPLEQISDLLSWGTWILLMEGLKGNFYFLSLLYCCFSYLIYCFLCSSYCSVFLQKSYNTICFQEVSLLEDFISGLKVQPISQLSSSLLFFSLIFFSIFSFLILCS